jgi:anti-sigma regulatory factor (Ser/Thr protein kinase)
MTIELEDITVQAGEHVVHFYEDESQLAATVGGYLTRALKDGAAVVVIATEAHRRLFTSELEAAGIDPVRSSRQGTLVLLDAAEVMARFTRAGGLDRHAFRHILGSALRQAADAGRPVCAYGEMVALLWEAGDVLAAIELERAWNELAAELPFGLLCAYRSESVTGDDHADALHEVCHLHTSVVDARASASDAIQTRAHFGAERQAPGEARHHVADVLTRWGESAPLVEDAKLVVTELAANAVVHARSAFSVEVRRHQSTVRVSVRDASPVKPTLRHDEMAASGRGLRLVDAIAANWGVEIADDGKTVWAELQS